MSVPLMVAGELAGLLNVASPVAAPIGERDFSAIRLVADRLTAALEIVHERKAAEERLSQARKQLRGGQQLSAQESLIDGDTLAYWRPLLEPLLEVAIASAGAAPGQDLGMLLVACAETSPDAMSGLAGQVRTIFANRPLVRFAEAELAVLIAATSATAVRSEAGDLVALAKAADMEIWCGYASLAPGWGPIELIAAAEAALEFARRVGPGTVVG